jgi:hypothetical protein
MTEFFAFDRFLRMTGILSRVVRWLAPKKEDVRRIVDTEKK